MPRVEIALTSRHRANHATDGDAALIMVSHAYEAGSGIRLRLPQTVVIRSGGLPDGSATFVHRPRLDPGGAAVEGGARRPADSLSFVFLAS